MSHKIGVFCSAQSQIDRDFFAAAQFFCDGLAHHKLELLYGGGQVGLMGHFANEALARSVRVTGVIPGFFQDSKEIMHPGLNETHVVSDLMERKRKMIELSSAFVVFPGGYGTLDEALEVLTMRALKLISHPLIFVNLKGFWKRQLDAFSQFHREGFASSKDPLPYTIVENVSDVWTELRREGILT